MFELKNVTKAFKKEVALLMGIPVWLGIVLSLGVSVVCFAETYFVSTCVNPLKALKTGGRG